MILLPSENHQFRELIRVNFVEGNGGEDAWHGHMIRYVTVDTAIKTLSIPFVFLCLALPCIALPCLAFVYIGLLSTIPSSLRPASLTPPHPTHSLTHTHTHTHLPPPSPHFSITHAHSRTSHLISPLSSRHRYFAREPNSSMRRCEELPWHLQLCRKWTSLKDTLADLKTFDMMYTRCVTLTVLSILFYPPLIFFHLSLSRLFPQLPIPYAFLSFLFYSSMATLPSPFF